MKILLTGDVNLTECGVVSYQRSRELLEKMLPIFDRADFRVLNLENPLAKAEECEELPKSGPNLAADPANIAFLKAASADGVTLANNHINDYLDKGLISTLRILRENHIAHAGAGMNIEEAYKACYFEKDGMTVSILSVCENEPGYATKTTCGSAGLNLLLLQKRLREEKAKADYVIIVFHGGTEYNPLPAPAIRDRYRLMIEMGADAVIAGHTHCPQGQEVYNGKPIVYSLGNFFFLSTVLSDQRPCWNFGSVCMLDVSPEGLTAELIPCCFHEKGIEPLTGEHKEKMLAYLEKISAPIQDDEALEGYYTGWAITHPLYPRTPENYEVDMLSYRACNLVTCEAHQELLKANYKTIRDKKVPLALQWAEKLKDLLDIPVSIGEISG